ncbi:hypothetical protein ACJMK2_016744 [Sinanodonta woodiana]|uniref:Pre-mRNA-splicing factor 18 n=1 Tax=Sinanodonta woodiana TaxID=1069815 RepID=A0ABD3UUN8_SINWO
MMDLLKAEIERKKRQLAESSILAPNKKYFKRGDLAAKQAEEYWRKHSQLVEQNEEDKKNEHEVPEQLDANKEEEGQRKEKEKHASLPRKEVIRRLRERGEPIRLFAETDYEAFERLKKLEAQEPDVKEDEGLGNDFQMALEKVDQDYLNELIRDSGGASSGGNSSNDVSIKDDGTTLEDIKEMRNILGKESSDKNQEIILRFLKYILKQWGIALNKKDEEEKRNMKGKMERAMHAQTVSYMKPLFRKLKHKTMQEDILECLVSIVGFLLERDYIKANDAYLEMAIGNAPWPIGVTMVGIHARTGREKISSRYVAHVLNDETQRKYIQKLFLSCRLLLL